MKKIGLLLVLFIAASCSCKKNPTKLGITLTSECPSDGDCKIEITEGKSIIVKTSESGSLYYELEESTSKKVVKYIYNRKVKGDLQDATYREEIIFELPSLQEETVLSNESLQDINLLFGRFCYCKGQTGYFAINQGTLLSVREKNQGPTHCSLIFKTEKVPQVISEISFDVQ